MPPFALNADVYSPIRLKAFAEQTQQFALGSRPASMPPIRGFTARTAGPRSRSSRRVSRSSESGESVHLPIDPA